MTEVEWLTCEDPNPLLKWLQKSKRHRPTLRKLGLFTCACAARLGEIIEKEVILASGLALAERLAEGKATPKEVKAFKLQDEEMRSQEEYGHIAVWAVRVLQPDSIWPVPETSARSVAGNVTRVLGPTEPAVQVRLLRDVLGNPYRRVTMNANWLAWNDGTIPRIAQAIYDERAFERLPILADALEDAGCDNADLLRHCREPGEHVRGCWVIDLLLGKK